jgi:hypothetical protein
MAVNDDKTVKRPLPKLSEPLSWGTCRKDRMPDLITTKTALYMHEYKQVSFSDIKAPSYPVNQAPKARLHASHGWSKMERLDNG